MMGLLHCIIETNSVERIPGVGTVGEEASSVATQLTEVIHVHECFFKALSLLKMLGDLKPLRTGEDGIRQGTPCLLCFMLPCKTWLISQAQNNHSSTTNSIIVQQNRHSISSKSKQNIILIEAEIFGTWYLASRVRALTLCSSCALTMGGGVLVMRSYLPRDDGIS